MPVGEIQNGKAVVFGIASSGNQIGIDGSDQAVPGYASFIWDTVKGAHKWDSDFIKDELNADAAVVASNPHIELDIVFTPAGSTRADVAGKTVFALPNSKVTLSDFKIAAFNGDYLLLSDQGIDLSHKEAKMPMKLRKYDDEDQNKSMTTTVSG